MSRDLKVVATVFSVFFLDIQFFGILSSLQYFGVDSLLCCTRKNEREQRDILVKEITLHLPVFGV